MEKILKTVFKTIPFTSVIALNVFADINHFNLENLRPLIITIGAILLLNLLISSVLKVKDYFLYGISVVSLLGIISVILFPSIGQYYIENVIVGLYLGLFIVAFFPPLFKFKPFTVNISKKDYPEVIVKSKQFLKINLIINYIWASLFAIAMVLTVVNYSENKILQTILSMVIPIILQLSIGILATKKIPLILMGKGSSGMHFETVKDLFEAMPHGLNNELAQGVNALIQFYLTGEDACIMKRVLRSC